MNAKSLFVYFNFQTDSQIIKYGLEKKFSLIKIFLLETKQLVNRSWDNGWYKTHTWSQLFVMTVIIVLLFVVHTTVGDY